MGARDTGLAARYAQALFGAARGRGAEEAVGGDMQSLLALDDRDASFRLFLESPNVRDDHKHALIDSLLGSRTHELTVRFVHLLLDKKRVGILRATADAYRTLLEEHKGLVRARVTTAFALAEETHERLRVALEARTGKKVVLESRVDAEVLGGVVVQWGDQIIDDTVRTRIAEVSEQLYAVEV